MHTLCTPVDSIIKTQLAHVGSDRYLPTTQAKQDLPTTQAKQDLPTTQAKQDLPTTQAKQDLPTTQAKQDLPTTQAKQDLPTTQAKQQGMYAKILLRATVQELGLPTRWDIWLCHIAQRLHA